MEILLVLQCCNTYVAIGSVAVRRLASQQGVSGPTDTQVSAVAQSQLATRILELAIEWLEGWSGNRGLGGGLWSWNGGLAIEDLGRGLWDSVLVLE